MNESDRDIENLTAIFRALGATDPESWARSQVEEGIPQLAIYLFLKSAVDPISELQGLRTLREILRRVGTREGVAALNRLAKSDESVADILYVVRSVLCDYLTEIAFLIDDAAAMRFSGWPFEETLERVRWGLFQTDADGKPIAALSGLHEVVAEFLPDIRAITRIAEQADEPDRNMPGELP